MTDTTKRILDLMEQKNVNAHQLEVAIGLPNASIQGWVKGKKKSDGTTRAFSPSTDSIAKLARYFNVSADYLLGLTDEPKPLSSNQTDVAERHDYALSSDFAANYEDIIKERAFNDLAKLYKAVDSSMRAQMLIVIATYLNRNGIDTESIVGY